MPDDQSTNAANADENAEAPSPPSTASALPADTSNRMASIAEAYAYIRGSDLAGYDAGRLAEVAAAIRAMEASLLRQEASLLRQNER